MFEHARLLLEEYYSALLAKGASKRAEHLLHELRGRLRTLQWLYARICDLSVEVEAEGRTLDQSRAPGTLIRVFSDGGRPNAKQNLGASPFSRADELRALLEAFYYCAFRVRDLCQKGDLDLPGLGKVEAVGVRDVRNHLVEHPDKKDGVIVSSFTASGPSGPKLKPLRWSGDPPGTLDAGLRANAGELERSLEANLTAAIAALAA